MIRSKRYRIFMLLIQMIDVLIDSEYDVPEDETQSRWDKYKPDKSVDTVEVKL